MQDKDYKEQVQMFKEGNPFKTLTDIVYDILLRDILEEFLLPKDQLYQNILADRFNISRTPVRDALNRLTEQGFLDKTGKCYVVHIPTASEVFLAAEFRTALECAALQAAARRILPDDTRRMKDILKETRRAVDEHNRKQVLHLDEMFHLAIFESTKNSYFVNSYLTVMPKLRVVRNTAVIDMDFSGIYESHSKITHYLELRREKEAVAAMKEHIGSMFDDLILLNPERSCRQIH